MYKTYQYRIKDSSQLLWLCKTAAKVNFVWNYCNETSNKAWRNNRKWLSGFDFNSLIAGSSKELGLNSAIIQLVAYQHADKRNQFKKSQLRWRSVKRTLGWIPLDIRCFTLTNDAIIVSKRKLKFWKHRELEGKIKTASLTQNSKKQWFVNVTTEIADKSALRTGNQVGVDLGFKDAAVCSDGTVYTHPKATALYAEKLAKAQRAKKKKLVTSIHLKIKNVRKDFSHKTSTSIVKSADTIFVGDVSSKAMISRGKGFAKSANCAAWGQLRTMLAYKAKQLGKVFQPVKEAWSTITCSNCSVRSGPSGLSNLGVRSWVCDCCGTKHSRDVNAAINIRNFGIGLYPPIMEAPAFRHGE